MASPETVSVTPAPVPTTWWQRNRRWFLPVVIIAPLFMCCLLCGVGVIFYRTGIQQHPAFQLTLETLRQNAEVRETLGEPISVASLVPVLALRPGGTVQTGPFELRFKISGPNGAALVDSFAETNEDHWILTGLTVTPDGAGAIEVVPPTGSAPDSEARPAGESSAPAAADKAEPAAKTE